MEAMYEFLQRAGESEREYSSGRLQCALCREDCSEILQQVVGGYIRMTSQKNILTFYKVIYSERAIQPVAAKILAEETERMILATMQLFYAMEVHELLHFRNPDMSAVSFAMTVHGLMDYDMDRSEAAEKAAHELLMNEYLAWFCEENAVK